MLTRIWEEHKRFIQIVGGGAFAFLILQWLAFSVEGSARNTLEKAIPRREDEIRKQLKRLDGHLDRERRDQPYLKEKAARLARSLGLSDAGVPTSSEGDLEIEFAQAWERIYRQVGRTASGKGIDLVAKTKVRFAEGDPRDLEAMRTKFRMLEVVERLLEALVAVDVPQVLEIRPGVQAEGAPIAKNPPDLGMLYYPVDFKIRGGFEHFTAFLAEVQKPERFLQVIPKSVALGREGLVEGELQAVGLALGELPSSARPSGRGPDYRPTRRPPRRFDPRSQR